MHHALTESDVVKLLSDPSPEHRAATAAKVAGQYDLRQLSDPERRLAEDIFRLMVRDAEVRVREALAHHLKQSRDLPRDVALALARDVASVAVPVLRCSEVLNDADLIEIVRAQDPAKQVAVAARPRLGAAVAEALVDCGSGAAVRTLVENEGAEIPEPALVRVVENYADAAEVMGALAERARLPLSVAERLLAHVSETIGRYLLGRPDLPPALAADLMLQARERAALGLSEEGSTDDTETLVRLLHDNGRLTPSIILRALCMGDITFLETALACLVGIPAVNARALIHDAGPLGLNAIYQRAGLPQSFHEPMRIAIAVAFELNFTGDPCDRERFCRLMMERMLTRCGHLGTLIEAEDVEYLLARLNRLPPPQG
ncbi:MAG: DUF2336 domain-containing protein [Rhodospirillales bacterium]|nr:DUF2336 domain-containing protein [Rhodospirillales bacterium]